MVSLEPRVVIEMKLTASKPISFYLKAAKNKLSDRDRSAVSKIKFSGTGSAIKTTVEVAANLEQEGLARIEKVETSFIPSGSNGRSCPRMLVELAVLPSARQRWGKLRAVVRAADAIQRAGRSGRKLSRQISSASQISEGIFGDEEVEEEESVERSVAPSHWRYLWDSRRPGDVPASVQSQQLPKELVLSCAAECAAGPEAFVEEVRELLSEYYVEDDDGMFRFDLSAEYLRWALLKPTTDLRCLVAARIRDSGIVIAFLAAIPLTMRDGPGLKKSAMIDFMCVHGDWRGKRLCPFLYHEVQNRCYELLGIDNLICTSGDNVPYPVVDTYYYHRSSPFSIPKLVSCGFSHLGPRMTMARTIKLYAIPESPVKLREMSEADVPSMRTAFNNYVRANFEVAHVFDTDEEFAHTFLPRKGIIVTYIVESPDPGLEMVSFFFNNSRILSGEGGVLRGAYGFYSMVTTTPRDELLKAAMVPLFNEHQADTMNCLGGIMGFDAEILRRCRFGAGTGELKWYCFNAKPGRIDISQIAWLTT